jgi:hypothetical protein
VTSTTRNREYEFQVGSQTFRALLNTRPYSFSMTLTTCVERLCLKSRTLFLDTVSTGSGSDLVNDGNQKSLVISHADH